MDDNMLMIPQVKVGIKHWTVKVTITEIMPALVGHQRGTRYKRYILTDDQGNTILAIVYGTTIPLFENVLELFHVYKISNAIVKLPTNSQAIDGYTKHWILQQSTLIRPLPDEQPNLRYFLDGIIPLDLITDKMATDEALVDIMAIVIKSSDSKEVSTKFGESKVQSFTIVDSMLRPMTLSLWGQQVEHQGSILTAAAAGYSVIVAKRVKVKNYRGPTLSINNGSSLTVEPPLETSITLKKWFDSVRDIELPKLLEGYSISSAKDLVDRNIIKKNSVAEVLAKDQCGEFWLRAFLLPSMQNERLYYIGCNKCFSKVDSLPGVQYYCLLCKKTVEASIRPRVSMDIYDHSGCITVGAIAEIAQEILQCSTENLSSLMDEGSNSHLESIRSSFQDKMYLVLLRRTYNKNTDAPKRVLLAAYYDDNMPLKLQESSETIGPASVSTSKVICESTTTTVIGSSSGAAEEIPSLALPQNVTTISPLKRQLATVTIEGSPVKRKLFSENETTATHVSAEEGNETTEPHLSGKEDQIPKGELTKSTKVADKTTGTHVSR